MPESEPRALPRAAMVVVITGSGSGIGAALARRLARLGRRLLLHARPGVESRVRLAQVSAACQALGAPKPAMLQAELGEPGTARQLVDAALDAFGALDQLVANAGFARSTSVASAGWDSMAEAFRVMPMSFAAMLREALPHLRASPCARVVAVSSFVAHRFDAATPFLETAAAKAALEAVVKSAAAELLNDGITVNCVVPGYTRKDRATSNPAAWMHAQQTLSQDRFLSPDMVAERIELLLGPNAGRITGRLEHFEREAGR